MKSLQVKNLSVTLQGISVLRNVSFALGAGGVSVMLGRSGAGKTTLLRAINRLNEHETACCTTGDIVLWLDGKSVPIYTATSYGKNAPLVSLDALRRRVGMVFQIPHVLPMSIAQNILFPLQFHENLAEEQCQQILQEVLHKVELWDDVCGRLHSPASELSGGQQQRLCLARTLVLQPEYLLLDEPTASLDVATTKGIESVIAEISKTTQCIMVCHSVEQALRLGERFVLLDTQGQVCVKSKNALTEEDITHCFEK